MFVYMWLCSRFPHHVRDSVVSGNMFDISRVY